MSSGHFLLDTQGAFYCCLVFNHDLCVHTVTKITIFIYFYFLCVYNHLPYDVM